MYESIQEYLFTNLPLVFIRDDWMHVLLILSVSVSFTVVAGLLIKNKKNILGSVAALFAVLGIAVGALIPSPASMELFVTKHPNHPDSLAYIDSLKQRSYVDARDLNMKWRRYYEGKGLLDLWQAISLLPKDHFLKQRYADLSVGSVMAYSDYQSIITELVVQEVENADLISSLINENETLL